MKSYRLATEKFRADHRRAIRNHIIIWGMGIICGFLVAMWRLPLRTLADWIAALIVCGFSSSVLCLLAVVAVWRRAKHHERYYYSYELVMEEDGIMRRQSSTPSLRLHYSEITSIQEVTGKGIFVRTASAPRFIWIPSELADADYAEVKQHLAAWRPFEAARQKLPVMYRPILGAVVGVAGVMVINLSQNRPLVLTLSFTFIALLGYAILHTLRSPNADARAKRHILVSLMAIGFILLRVKAML